METIHVTKPKVFLQGFFLPNRFFSWVHFIKTSWKNTMKNGLTNSFPAQSIVLLKIKA